MQNCEICFKYHSANGTQPNNNVTYSKELLSICAKHLLSERFKIDWRRISLENDLPFCAGCVYFIGRISKLDDEIEKTKSDILKFVTDFVTDVMKDRNNQTLHKIMHLFGHEDIGRVETEIEKCISCYTECNRNEIVRNKLTNDERENILKQCKKYLYPYFDVDQFFWNKIPFQDHLPFCFYCFLNVEMLCDLASQLASTEVYKNGFVAGFVTQVLESRKAITTEKEVLIVDTESSVNTRQFLSGGTLLPNPNVEGISASSLNSYKIILNSDNSSSNDVLIIKEKYKSPPSHATDNRNNGKDSELRKILSLKRKSCTLSGSNLASSKEKEICKSGLCTNKDITTIRIPRLKCAYEGCKKKFITRSKLNLHCLVSHKILLPGSKSRLNTQCN